MDQTVTKLANDPEIKPLLAVSWMKPEQRDEHRQDIEEIETVLNDPARRKGIVNPGTLRTQMEQRKRNLERQTPPPLTVSQRDKLVRFERAALAAFTENMPSQEAMRHKPPGAGDHHDAWESENKQTVLWWKRARRCLEPDNRARDFGNIERFRPSMATQSLMTNAQINRPFAFSAHAKANYDSIDWGQKETQKEFVTRLAELGIAVTFTKRPLRVHKDGGKVYECTHAACGGRIFSGGFGKANFTRHMEKHVLVGAGDNA
mgnify:FL=1